MSKHVHHRRQIFPRAGNFRKRLVDRRLRDVAVLKARPGVRIGHLGNLGKRRRHKLRSRAAGRFNQSRRQSLLRKELRHPLQKALLKQDVAAGGQSV